MKRRSPSAPRERRTLAWFGPLAFALAVAGCEELPPAPATPNLPPTSSFFYTPVAPIIAGQTSVSFNAMGSRDIDGQIASFVWDFGDGTPPLTTTTPNAVHVFPDTGSRCLDITYGVSLQVVDQVGDRGVATEAVKVTEPPAPTSQECTGR